MVQTQNGPSEDEAGLKNTERMNRGRLTRTDEEPQSCEKAGDCRQAVRVKQEGRQGSLTTDDVIL